MMKPGAPVQQPNFGAAMPPQWQQVSGPYHASVGVTPSMMPPRGAYGTPSMQPLPMPMTPQQPFGQPTMGDPARAMIAQAMMQARRLPPGGRV